MNSPLQTAMGMVFAVNTEMDNTEYMPKLLAAMFYWPQVTDSLGKAKQVN